jgi:kynureninase
LQQWWQFGVEGFTEGNNPWLHFHDQLAPSLSRIVGALPHEVVVMNHLTVNLHLLMSTFYRPKGKRNKIICEAKAFSSDQYMLETHVQFHALDPSSVIIEVHPREGEYEIRHEDILQTIRSHSNEIALVFWGGVNYYSGQLFDIKAIGEAAHEAGALAGFDLAHAAGNVALELHEWQTDFACWCNYKYLNGGPGTVGSAFIHERYHKDVSLPRLAGWWGYEKDSRFKMNKGFKAIQSAEGWQLSTPPMILYAALKASLEIFDEAGIGTLVQKGRELSDHLVSLLNDVNEAIPSHPIKIITPESKGCQVSMLIKENARRVFEQLRQNEIFADWREPGVIRVAPVPLYNSFDEVFNFVQVIKKLLA